MVDGSVLDYPFFFLAVFLSALRFIELFHSSHDVVEHLVGGIAGDWRFVVGLCG
jgi:hypothetical protein